MARHIACLTFDFDAWSGLTARGLTTATPVSRGEFGPLGVRRILPLLQRNGIAASFFVPGIVIETYPQVCGEIVAGGHEIGHHGYTHRVPATLTQEVEEEGLMRGIECIEKLTGRRPRGYRSPSWDISDRTVELLLREGFLYESNLMGNDYTPYFTRRGDVASADAPLRFGEHTSLIEMPVAWSLDDFPHFEFLRTQQQLMPGLMNARLVLENWIADYDYMAREFEWGVITFTFHPFVIGRGHRMLALEGLIEHLKNTGAVFMRLEDAAREFQRKVDSGEVTPYP
ncbi:MAG: polysaccharide deacetylase [Gammaproteobacteria bacterium]